MTDIAAGAAVIAAAILVVIAVGAIDAAWRRATFPSLDFRTPWLHWWIWQTIGVTGFVVTVCILLVPPRPTCFPGAWRNWRACMRRARHPKPPKGRIAVSDLRDAAAPFDDGYDVWSPSRGEWITGDRPRTFR